MTSFMYPIFVVISYVITIQLSNSGDISLLPNSPLGQRAKIEEPLRNRLIRALPKMMQLNLSISTLQSNVKFIKTHLATDREVDISALQISNLDTIQVPPVSEKANPSRTHATSLPETIRPAPVSEKPILSKNQKGPAVTSGTARFGIDSAIPREEDRADPSPLLDEEKEEEKKGLLFCNGKQTDSEVIYWKIVPGDSTYESPITPHHGVHHDRQARLPSLCVCTDLILVDHEQVHHIRVRWRRLEQRAHESRMSDRSCARHGAHSGGPAAAAPVPPRLG